MQKAGEKLNGKLGQNTNPTLLSSEDISGWHDHIIISGLHNLGFRIVEQLHATGVKVVVIDDQPDPRKLRLAQRMGIKILEEDSRNPQVLEEAGIYRATAIIASEENDLHNLETVLVANELVPGIRTVASFFNQRVGQQLAQAVSNAKALSLSEKAGPSFVEACTPSSVLHLFDVHGEDVIVVKSQVTQNGTVQELFGGLVPLVIQPANSKETDSLPTDWKFQPDRAYPLQVGQVVILAGRREELQKLAGVKLKEEDLQEALKNRGSSATSSFSKPKNSDSKTQRFLGVGGVVSNIIKSIDRPFRYALLFVLTVVIFSTILLWLTYRNPFTTPEGTPQNFSLLDAIYFTVTIIDTVGFGDYGFAQQEWWVKIFGIFLILLGTASVSILYAFVTNFIISRRIEEALGRHKATDMQNHIVLCGLGTVGYQVMQGLLKQGERVAVIEKNISGRFNSEAQSQGVPIIYGDARLPQVLKAANLAKAKAIAVLTSDDLANLETALSARAEFAAESPNNRAARLQLVLRLFDNNLADRVAKTFDLNISYSASALAAPYFVAAALDYTVVSTFYLQRQPFIVVRLKIEEAGSLHKLTVQQLYQQTGMWIVAYIARPQQLKLSGVADIDIPAEELKIQQLEPTFYPNAGLELAGGDIIYLVGSYERVIATYLLNKPTK